MLYKTGSIIYAFTNFFPGLLVKRLFFRHHGEQGNKLNFREKSTGPKMGQDCP